MNSHRPSLGPISRRSVLAAGLGLSAAALTGCGGGRSAQNAAPTAAATPAATAYEGPDVALQFWNPFTGGDGTYMKRLVNQFNTEHGNIAVSVQTMQWADYNTKLPTAVQAGKGPEVAIMAVDSLATNAARRIIQPLDDVANALQLTEADFAPVPWNAGIYRGVRYGIPLDVHPLGFFYNKAVMEKAGLDPDSPPMDTNAYMDALDKLKAKGIKGHWASPFPFTGSLTAQSLIHQFGGTLYNEDGTEATFNDDASVKALTWWQNLIKQGYSPAKVAQDADLVALQNGQNAFNWNGIWTINTLGEKKDLQWGVSRLPSIGGTDAAWAGSHQFVLPTQKNAEANKATAAKVFVNWISQHSLEWAKGGQVPARNSVRESPEFAKLTGQAELAKQVDVLVFPPAIPGIADAAAEFDKSINQITLGQKDVATTLNGAAERATKVLQANAKKYGV